MFPKQLDWESTRHCPWWPHSLVVCKAVWHGSSSMAELQTTTEKWLLIFWSGTCEITRHKYGWKLHVLTLLQFELPFRFQHVLTRKLQKGTYWSRRCRCLINVTDCKDSNTMLDQCHLVPWIVVLNCQWLEKGQGMSLAKKCILYSHHGRYDSLH